jgi:hypothetical protein
MLDQAIGAIRVFQSKHYRRETSIAGESDEHADDNQKAETESQLRAYSKVFPIHGSLLLLGS